MTEARKPLRFREKFGYGMGAFTESTAQNALPQMMLPVFNIMLPGSFSLRSGWFLTGGVKVGISGIFWLFRCFIIPLLRSTVFLISAWDMS